MSLIITKCSILLVLCQTKPSLVNDNSIRTIKKRVTSETNKQMSNCVTHWSSVISWNILFCIFFRLPICARYPLTTAQFQLCSSSLPFLSICFWVNPSNKYKFKKFFFKIFKWLFPTKTLVIQIVSLLSLSLFNFFFFFFSPRVRVFWGRVRGGQ